MRPTPPELNTLRDIGEKRLIEEIIRPLFNLHNDPNGVGDDCAMLGDELGTMWLLSTDRVPKDLVPYELGLIDLRGMGRHLARLNISDIAACGGKPLALLLNLGLPSATPVRNLVALCEGFLESATLHGCTVLGGDLSESPDLNLVATSIGTVQGSSVLRRRGANTGDIIFVSRPVGLSPAALAFFRQFRHSPTFSRDDASQLEAQLTSLEPSVDLGIRLSASGHCTSCMDNTDGVAQCFYELSTASGKRFVIDSDVLPIPELVANVAAHLQKDPVEFALGAGADFSLVGTLRGALSPSDVEHLYGSELTPVGRVEDGSGVYLERAGSRVTLQASGWSYFGP